MNTKTRILTLGTAAALLLGTASAQPGFPAGMEAVRAQRGMDHPHAAGHSMEDGARMDGLRMAGHRLGGKTAPGLLRGGLPFGAPLGTEIEVRFYDAEPTGGVEPVATLALTVGEDSEAAFLEDFAAAREDAAYLVVNIGEQTRSIDLPDADAGDAPTTVRARPGMALAMARHAALEDGDTITVAFFDGIPDEGASELQTLTFTYGEDSAVGFRQDVTDAAEAADWAVVTLPPRTHTVDLSAVGPRDGMRPALGRFGVGGFGTGRR